MQATKSLFAVAALAVAGQASAAVIYSTDFTSADGYADATDITGTDGWSAQVQLDAADVAGTGELDFTANFVRGFNAGTAFAVGETITITTQVKSKGGTTPGFDANLFQMGLTSSTNLGSAGVQAGVNLGGGGSGSNFDIAFTAPTGTDADTSVAIDTAYHTLVTKITKTATTNEFSVTNSLDSFSQGPTTITNSALYGASTVYTLVYSQGAANTGGIALDSIEVDLIPEPASLALLGLGSLALLGRRRSA